MSKGFEFENKFNTDNAFTSIRFGYDRPILETELNEMQEIQNYNRKSLMHKICKSGIIDLIDKDFQGEKIVYNPNTERNKIAIAPMRVNINGYELHVCGDYQIDEIKNYLDIDLGDAPSGTDSKTKHREDLVYLQMWFEELNSNSNINRYGNLNASTIENTMIDERVEEETSHRVGLRWKINVANDVDFNTWEYGFGYDNNSANNYSPIITDITSNINIVDEVDKVFANATHLIFQGCNFFGDNNLWIAGRPNSLNHTIKIEPYIESDGTVSNIFINKIETKSDSTSDKIRTYDLSEIDFFGSWSDSTDTLGKNIKSTNGSNSYAYLNFTGDNITIYAGNVSKNGKYIITIDDETKYTIDLSSGNIDSDDDGNLKILEIQTLYSYDTSANTKDSNYVFAIPLFKVVRRNQKPYSILNPYGSVSYNDKEINNRPDNKCYDMIYESDILDLRKNVIINNNEINYYLDNTLNKLFTGSLTTKSNQKMKRAQFGVEPLTGTETDIIFLDSFVQSTIPKLGSTPIITQRDTYTMTSTLNYCPSVTEWGLEFDGNIKYTYNNLNSINVDEGTVDFFIIPNWNGFDEINQTLFNLNNSTFSYPFLTVNKESNKLVIKRYADSTSNPYISIMKININNILANKIYHIRICWSRSQNTLECYINGNFAGNSLDKYIPSASPMIINQLIIGDTETLNSSGELDSNMGFIMDEFAIYKSYLGNSNWTLPQDYIDGNAVILPSMNGIYRNYRDNIHLQDNMTTQLITTANTNTFTITAPHGTVFSNNTPKLYCMSKTTTSPSSINIGDEIKGTWSGLNTSSLKFVMGNSIPTFLNFTGETFAVVYDVILSSINQIDDVPIELLKSEVYHMDTHVTNEVSFNVENNTNDINDPREIETLITPIVSGATTTYTSRRYLYDVWDTAYDFSTYRNDDNGDFAFARLLDYNMAGNRTSLYTFETSLYGYDVLYVRNAYWIHNNTSRIKTITPLNILKVEKKVSASDPSKIYYNVYVNKTIDIGDYIKFELALGGTTFDYNTNSKTFIGNLCSAEYLEFTTTGDTFEYVIPLNNVTTTGLCNKGIIKSLGTQYTHSFDSNGVEIIDPTYYGDHICFIDDLVYKYTYEDGIGKPFLKIHLSTTDPNTGNEIFITSGSKVKIPIFITYQPTSNDILSVWYNYIPYQGILDNNKVELKRLSDWKYFITSLGSGNQNDNLNNSYSLNDLINHLPGGANGGSKMTGQDINLKPYSFSDFSKIDEYDLNKQLLFINQTYIGTVSNDIDSYLFNLDTDYTIYKKYDNIQDDIININNKDFKIIFPKCEESINKYCGMSCIVSDKFGDLYLFIIGDTNNYIPSTNNTISPNFGDLFIIPYRPSFINRK